MVADPGAGQVDDGVDAVEGGGIEASGVGVPTDLAGGGVPAHDPHAVVTARREVLEERVRSARATR